MGTASNKAESTTALDRPRRVSGIHIPAAARSLTGQRELAADAIAAANADFQRQVGGMLSIPIAVLTRQRDEALRAAEQERVLVEETERRLLTEQDQLIAELMRQQEDELRQLQAALDAKTEELERAVSPAPSAGGESDEAALREQITDLRAQLEAANREVDDTRAEAVRLQSERDEAIMSTDEVRVELYSQIETLRDEANDLQLEMDEMRRLHEDAEAQFRVEVLRLTDELSEAREEIQRLGQQSAHAQHELNRTPMGMHAQAPEAELPTNPFASR